MDDFNDVDFSGIPQEDAEILKNIAREKIPHRQERKGRISAETLLSTNKVTNPLTIEAVLNMA